MQQLLKAVSDNREASDGFTRVFSGVVSPAEFFSEENVKRIFALSPNNSPIPQGLMVVTVDHGRDERI